MDNYTIKAYKFVNGKEDLQSWASGFSYKHAKYYFQSLYDSNEYSKVHMYKVES